MLIVLTYLRQFFMFERFTEKAIKVVLISQEESRRMGHNYVGTEQILLGIMGEGSNAASEALKNTRLTMRRVRFEIEEVIGRGNGFVAVEIPFTPRAKEVLEDSLDIARELGHGYVTTEHLILSLLSQEEGLAWTILTRHNVDCDAIRRGALTYLGVDLNSPAAAKLLPVAAGGKFSNSSTREYSLEDYTTNLSKQAREGFLDKVVGRDKEIERVIQILVRRKKNNPVLIGEPGVGKTAVAEGLALRIKDCNVPEMLQNRELISLDIGLLLAGTKYRGEFEERIKRVMDEVQNNKDFILVIDEIHMVIGAGAAEGAMDAANILKPALARGELQCLGATTIEEYRKNIEKDPALERRFQPVTVPEPSVEDTINILIGLRPSYEEHHQVSITAEALEAAAKLGSQFIADRFLPDKAIDLIDESCARRRILMLLSPSNLQELNKELSSLKNRYDKALNANDSEKAESLAVSIESLKKQLDVAKKTADVKRRESPPDSDPFRSVVIYDDVAEVVSDWTGIPVNKVSKDETSKLVDMEKALHNRVIGQQAAVSAVSAALRRARVGLKNPNRPIASFIFAGPTGVGKTELTKALASYFFGSENAMVRLDMSEYMERHNIAKLIGSPPGYVGFSDGGYLTEEVRRKPYTLLLFDEVEKAHPDVFNLLLQILEDGRLTDSQGRLISFKNTLIILTSNIGAKSIEDAASNQDFNVSGQEIQKQLRDLVHSELREFFRPEFLNRLDEIIVFQPLTRSDIQQIADLLLKEITTRIAEQGIVLKISSAARDKLATEGFNPSYGARPLRRTIMTMLEDKLANLILTLDRGNKYEFKVDVEFDEIVVDSYFLGPQEVEVPDEKAPSNKMFV